MKNSLSIYLELVVVCPSCGNHEDLRENDFERDYFWSDLAIKRLSGKIMEISEVHECSNCGKEIKINQFEVL